MIAFAVHGGAWEIPSGLIEECRTGVRKALDTGWDVLRNGGSALDACEEAIVVLEEEPVFDAGIGSHLNRDGRVELDAILMDGRFLNAGALAGVSRLRNPIRTARKILESSDHLMLVGAGAEEFAGTHGIALCKPEDLVVPRELSRWQEGRTAFERAAMGTVGAVALDARGDLAAGTSTGGTFFKLPGRVGDSPLIGCGCYADNLSAAVSSTGHGESIMKVVLAKSACDRVAGGMDPQSAASYTVQCMTARTGGRGGLIAIDPQGRIGAAFTTSHMAWAWRTSESDAPVVIV